MERLKEGELTELPGDVDGTGPGGLSWVHAAVMWGRRDTLRRLLEAGASPKAKTTEMLHNVQDGDKRVSHPEGGWFYRPKPQPLLPVGFALDKGATPLHVAASLGDLEALELLLAHKARGVNDGVGARPLHLALLKGHRAVGLRLLEGKPKVEAPIKVRKGLLFYDVGMTPLLAALEGGELALVQALLERGADPLVRTKAGCSAAFFAARGGCVPAMEALAAAGVKVDDCDYSNFPLVEAVARGHLEMVELLLSLGSPTAEPGGSQAPLRLAIRSNQQAIREALLAGGADPLPDRGPVSAARDGDVVYLQAYLAAGGDPNVVEGGATPLMQTAAQGHLQAARVLVQGGADPALGQQGGALGWGISNDHWDIVQLMVDAGPDCSGVDSYGNGLLFGVVMAGKEALATQMMALGADPHQQNRSGRSPLELAREMGLEALVRRFEGQTPGVDAQAKVWKALPQSKVLSEATGDEPWQDLHQALWQELVPPSGPAPSLQGELVRCIGSLTDEAYRNGNINWGARHRAMVDTLEQHLGPGASPALKQALRQLRQHRRPDLSGQGSPHYQVSEAVVRFCLEHRELSARP